METPSFYPASPGKLWPYFHAITQLPRPSKHEDKIRHFILNEAKKLGHGTHVDQAGNVIVYVPGSKGKEANAPVIIQNHMDMVTDATHDRMINFMTDPISTLREGEWIKADRTTLGADNGIGCAAVLALMSDPNLSHPPLELLFTTDEETGLKGAWGVDPSKLRGKKMLNLDTEEWGSFYIGCAGGIEYEFRRGVKMIPSKIEGRFFKIKVSGFQGGHSGIDIHEQRGNAIKFLMEWLNLLPSNDFELVEWRGGKAHNIIPRDAFAIIKTTSSKQVLELGQALVEKWNSFLPKSDRSVSVSLEEALNSYDEVIDPQDFFDLHQFLMAFPHGAHAFDLSSSRELCSLSNNLAITLMVRGQFYLQTSLRFFNRAECVGLENQVTSLARGFGLEFSKNGEYPSWNPDRENKLLELVCEKYEHLFKKKAKITAIHAGLECGILRDKIGPIDVVSFGPTIVGAHSPDERVSIPTVDHFWKLLVEVLAVL